MTLYTGGINVEISFNALLSGYTTETQNEINALLSTSYSIPYYPGQAVESFPSVQSNFFTTGGQDSARHRLVDRVQIDVRTNNQSEAERKRLNRLIRDNLTNKLGLKIRRNSLHAYFPVNNFLENPSASTRQQNARIELFSTAGWLYAPDADPNILRWLIDFQIFYK